MINGYEYLYREEDGKKPKYDLRKSDKLAHNLDGSGKQNHLGVTINEAYANLIEQNIGKKFYEKMSKMFSDYQYLYNIIQEYSKNKLLLDQEEELFKSDYNHNKKLNNEKKEIETKIKDLLKSNKEKKSIKIKEYADKLEDLEIEIADVKISLKENETNFANRHKIVDEKFKTIKQLLTSLKKALENFDKEGCDEVAKKFTSPKFQMQIEQEFVDTMLLPGEEKKEGNVRIIAQTYFAAYKMEAKYLVSMDSAIKDLIECVEGQIKSTDLPDIYVDAKSQGKYEILYGLKSVSTDVIENHQNRFESKNFCQFYKDVFKMMKESSYGKNPSSELYNLPEFAMQSHKFKNTSKRNGEDLDTNTDIFNGVQHLLEGNVYNSEGIEL